MNTTISPSPKNDTWGHRMIGPAAFETRRLGNRLVHPFIIGGIIRAMNLIVVEFTQFENGAAHLRGTGALINQSLVDDLADLR